jgi:hypothetical protein
MDKTPVLPRQVDEDGWRIDGFATGSAGTGIRIGPHIGRSTDGHGMSNQLKNASRPALPI